METLTHGPSHESFFERNEENQHCLQLQNVPKILTHNFDSRGQMLLTRIIYTFLVSYSFKDVHYIIRKTLFPSLQTLTTC